MYVSKYLENQSQQPPSNANKENSSSFKDQADLDQFINQFMPLPVPHSRSALSELLDTCERLQGEVAILSQQNNKLAWLAISQANTINGCSREFHS